MAKSARQRQGAVLLIALGVAAIAFGVVGSTDHGGRDGDTDDHRPTSGPTVLGVVVTPELPAAPAAAPATFDVVDRTTATTRRATTTTTSSTSSTTTPPTLVPPTSIENTTTTAPPPTFVEPTTTTTEPTTTTTEVPPAI